MFGSHRLQLYFLVTLATCLHWMECRSVRTKRDASDGSGPEATWTPDTGSRQDWLRCHGMPCVQWQQIQTKLNTLQHNRFLSLSYDSGFPQASTDGCLWYTEPQVSDLLVKQESNNPEKSNTTFQQERSTSLQSDSSGIDYAHAVDQILKHKIDDNQDALNAILQRLGSSEDGHRKLLSRRKRTLEDLQARPSLKWGRYILFKFDGSQEQRDRDVIRRAFRHWSDHTCISFGEVSTSTRIRQQHLLLTSENYGAKSFVGRTGLNPQQLNLPADYLKLFGTPVHEIGHALGLWHEQQRVDRDDYINLVTNNIAFYRSQFWKRNTVSHGVPYDYSSVMHYTATAGSFDKKITMEARRPLYTRSMGQRVGLSYYDAKIINLEYCNDSCRWSRLSRNCERGGYQDPNNCLQCRCPDGFGGQFCQLPGPAKNARCGGVIDLNSENRTAYVTSPGYVTPGYYDDHTECNWILRAPVGQQLVLTFEGEFGAYCHELDTCYHWVEVKHTKDFEYPGPRLCCYQTPASVTSETHEMVISFRSSFSTDWATVRRGFRARVETKGQFNGGTVRETPGEVVTTTPTLPPTQSSPGTRWSRWGRCHGSDCSCGGCGSKTRYRLCRGNKRCAGGLAAVQTRVCDRLCTDNDTIVKFIGAVVNISCPLCCQGFLPRGNRCVPL